MHAATGQNYQRQFQPKLRIQRQDTTAQAKIIKDDSSPNSGYNIICHGLGLKLPQTISAQTQDIISYILSLG